MNVDLKRNSQKQPDFMILEKSDKFNINDVPNLQNIDNVYLLNNKNKAVTRKNQTQLKQFFSNNKTQLKILLNQIIKLNKNDFDQENKKYLKELYPDQLNRQFAYSENKHLLRYVGQVSELPQNAKTGEIYGLKQNDKTSYYLFINNGFLMLLDKTYYEENYYTKAEVTTKLSQLSSKITDLLLAFKTLQANSISKQQYQNYLMNLAILENQMKAIKEQLDL